MTYSAKEDIMNRCIGCGAILQNEKNDKEGYTKNLENNLCERCFRIKHYNEYQNISKTNEDFTNIFKEIEKTGDLVLLLVDILNIDSLSKIKLSNDVILVITKIDVWPRAFNPKKLLDLKINLNIIDKIFISSFKNYNMDELLSKIKKHKKTKNVYVMGFTNAGKSTMINKILKNYSLNESNLTVSALPSTTLDFLKVEIDEQLTLIDTPGLIEDGNICNVVEASLLKKIIPTKEINPKIYQVKTKQSIIVDNIFRLDVEQNNLTFVMSNNLSFDRIYKENDKLTNYKKIELDVPANSDIVILGLGFVKVRDSEKIVMYIDEKIKVYIRKSVI